MKEGRAPNYGKRTSAARSWREPAGAGDEVFFLLQLQHWLSPQKIWSSAIGCWKNTKNTSFLDKYYQKNSKELSNCHNLVQLFIVLLKKSYFFLLLWLKKAYFSSPNPIGILTNSWDTRYPRAETLGSKCARRGKIKIGSPDRRGPTNKPKGEESFRKVPLLVRQIQVDNERRT